MTHSETFDQMSGKAACMDEEPWTPSDSFDEVVIRVNEKGECVVAGPEEKVAEVKKEILEFLGKGQQSVLPETIERIELEAKRGRK